MKIRKNKMKPTFNNIEHTKGYIGVLDIGTFKTVCLIAKRDKKMSLDRIVGVGLSRSSGIKSGLIVDISAAQECIRKAVADAERMAGVQLDQIDVALNCGNQRSHGFKISLSVPSRNIDKGLLSILNRKAIEYAERASGYLIYINPVTYHLKGGSISTLNPEGLYSEALNGFFHAVTADIPAITNLYQTLDRSYLSPNIILPGSLASALAVTQEEERNSGVIVLDIGSGVTAISVFSGGRFIYSDSVTMGGGDITLDIAHVLRTPLEEAERIKTLYGTIIGALSDQHDIFTYNIRDGEELSEQTATISDLSSVIRSRVIHILNLVYERLVSRGVLKNSFASVVICGGTSRLVGITSLAETVFKSYIREGRPEHVSGLPPLLASSEFSCAVGLLRARSESGIAVSLSPYSVDRVPGYLSKVGKWIRDGF